MTSSILSGELLPLHTHVATTSKTRRATTKAQRIAELPPVMCNEPENKSDYIFCEQIKTWIYADDFYIVLQILNEVNNPKIPHSARHGAAGHRAHRTYGCRGPLCARASRVASWGPSKSARYIRLDPLILKFQAWYNEVWLERETRRLREALESETA